MPEDKRKQAQELASSALDDLTNPSVPIENAIRRAMRVAALSGHPFWRAWLQLQLVDFREAKGDLKAMREMLQGYFPDDSHYQKVAKNVLVDYIASRSSPAFEDKMYGAPVTDMESMVETARQLLRGVGQPDAQVMVAVQRSSQMLSRIKNRIQQYLMNVESGDLTASQETGEDEPSK
jgi:hypothetical protein